MIEKILFALPFIGLAILITVYILALLGYVKGLRFG